MKLRHVVVAVILFAVVSLGPAGALADDGCPFQQKAHQECTTTCRTDLSGQTVCTTVCVTVCGY